MIIVGINGRADTGKDTIAARLIEQHGFQVFAFATPIWAALEEVGAIDEHRLHDRTYKESPLPGIGKSPRQLAQEVGDYGRALHPQLFIHAAEVSLHVFKLVHRCDRVVFSDVRLESEAEWISSKGGAIWCVTRNGVAPVRAHLTEGYLPLNMIDQGIHNDGTVEQLHERVDYLVEKLIAQQAQVS